MSESPPGPEPAPVESVAHTATSSRKANLVLWIARIVLLGSSVVVVVNAIRATDLRVAGRLLQVAGPWLLLALLPALLSANAQVAGWRAVFTRLGRPLGYFRLLAIRIASEAVYLSAPAGTAASDAVALYLLDRNAGVPVPAGLAAIAARRSLVVLGNAMYVLTAFVFAYQQLARAALYLGAPRASVWCVFAAAVALFVSWFFLSRMLFSGSLVKSIVIGLSRIPTRAVRGWLDARKPDVSETDRYLNRLLGAPAAGIVLSAAAYLCAWLLEGCECLIIVWLLGTTLRFREAIAIDVVVSLLRSAAFVLPAGLGVQEAGYLVAFQTFGVTDPAATAVAFAVAKRLKDLFWIGVGYTTLKLLGPSQAARVTS